MKRVSCLGPMYSTPEGSLVVGSSVGSTVVSSVGSTEGSLVLGSSVVVVVVSISHPTLRLVFGHLPSSLPQVISSVAISTQRIFLSSSHIYSVYPSSESS